MWDQQLKWQEIRLHNEICWPNNGHMPLKADACSSISSQSLLLLPVFEGWYASWMRSQESKCCCSSCWTICQPCQEEDVITACSKARMPISAKLLISCRWSLSRYAGDMSRPATMQNCISTDRWWEAYPAKVVTMEVVHEIPDSIAGTSHSLESLHATRLDNALLKYGDRTLDRRN